MSQPAQAGLAVHRAAAARHRFHRLAGGRASLADLGRLELPYRGNTGRYPEYERPGRRTAANPDDDEEFLRGLRERAEQQRREYQARRARELAEEQERQRLERQRWEQPDQDGN